jgi:hypothetical protein
LNKIEDEGFSFGNDILSKKNKSKQNKKVEDYIDLDFDVESINGDEFIGKINKIRY